VTRLSPLDTSSFTEEEAAIHTHVLTVPHNPTGPTAIWSRSPELCRAALDFGDFIRFRSTVDPRVRELSICVTAAHYSSENEWAAHAPQAERAGVPPHVLEAIHAGQVPQFDDERDELAWQVATELHRDHTLTDRTWELAQARWGDRGMVELISTVGFYSMVALLLNGTKAELNPPRPAQQH